MSRMEGSAEASMEEILASIRKIIADDPASKGSADAPDTAASGLPLPSTRDVLTADSGQGAARSGNIPFFRPAPTDTPAATTPAPSMPQRSRAAAIDDDLAGLIDTAAPASKPHDSVSPVEAAREKWANLINPTVPASIATPPAPEPKFENTPASPVAVPPAPVTSGLFAPRKGGFYPPQEPMAALPRASDPIFQPAPVPIPASMSPGFIPMPRSIEPVPTSVAPTPPVEELAPASPPVSALPDAAFPDPVMARIDDRAADTASAAAARALDDLVAGFAKTSAPVAPPQTSAPIPERPTVAVASAKAATDMLTGRAFATPSAAAAPAPAPAADTSAAGRTLEDVVAEMVRPMLEKWIDANMPRIVERALKLDTSTGPKSGA